MAIKSGIRGFGEAPSESANIAASLYPATYSFWDRVKDQVRINPNGTLEQWYANSVGAINPPDWNNYIMNFGSMVYRPPVAATNQTLLQTAGQIVGGTTVQQPSDDPSTFRGAVTNLTGGVTSNLNVPVKAGIGGLAGGKMLLPLLLLGAAYWLFFRKK